MDENNELVAQLLKAAGNGDTETAKGILNQGLEINTLDVSGDSALHCAVKKQQYEFILFLFTEGAVVDFKTKDQSTSLHLATLNSDVKIMELLLNNNARIEEKDGNGKTALHHACDVGKADLVNVLLKRGANVNIKDATGKTPLHILVSTGGRTRFAGQKLKIIDAFIELGANVNEQDNEGCTPLHVALKSIENQYVLQRLLEVGASVVVLNSQNKTCYDVCLEKCKAGNFVWEETEHDSFNNRTVVIKHILKLKLAAVTVDIDVRDRTEGDYEFERIKVQLLQELERIKVYKVCDDFSLGIIFSAFKNPYYLKNEKLSAQIDKFLNSAEAGKLFPAYCFILRSTYQVSKHRLTLLSRVSELLNKVCVITCGKNLPDLAVDQVLDHLDTKDLENMILIEREESKVN